MAVCEGDKAPDFEAPNQIGESVRLSELLKNGPVVLYFYPKAMTPGCTKESCYFRDMGQRFDQLGAQRIGISADGVQKQAKFADKYSLDFPLLSDPDFAIADSFGASRPGPLMNKRMTFVIGRDGTVLDVIKSELSMQVHADRALETLTTHLRNRVL